MLKIWIIIIITGLSIPLAATEHPDSLMRLGELLLEENANDEALKVFEKAGNLYRELNELALFIQARVQMCNALRAAKNANIGSIPQVLQPALELLDNDPELLSTTESAACYLMLGRHQRQVEGDYPGAIQSLNQSIQIAGQLAEGEETHAEALSERSQIYANREQFDSALIDMQEVLDLVEKKHSTNSVEWASKSYNLAFIYYRQGNYDRAEKSINEGLEISENVGAPPMQIARGLSNLSAIQTAKLDVKAVERTADAFIEIAMPLIGPDHPAMANINWDLGMCYSNTQESGKALQHLHTARTIYTNAYGDKFQQLPDLYHLLGTAYNQLGKSDSSTIWHLRGLNLKNEIWNNDPIRMSESYRFLVEHYLELDEIEKADSVIQLAANAAQSLDEKTLSRAWFYELKGDFFARKQMWDSAAINGHRVLFTLSDKMYEPDLAYNPNVQDIYNFVQVATSAQKKASALWQKWKIENIESDLHSALHASNLADTVIDKLRSYYRTSESKVLLQNNARDHYETRAEICFQLYELTNEIGYLELFYQCLEKSRSLLLTEALKNRGTAYFDLEDSILLKQSDLQLQLALAESNWLNAKEKADSINIIHLKKKYNELNDRNILFTKELIEKHPNYYYWLQNPDVGSVEEIRNKLNKDAVLIMYYFTEHSVFTLSIESENIIVKKLAPASEVGDLLDSIIQNQNGIDRILADPNSAIRNFKKRSHKLYTILIEPLKEILITKKKVIFVPDQTLAYMPFEALFTNKDFDSENYLLNQINIAYAYSAKYYLGHEKQSKRTYSNFAGYAPSYGDKKTFEDANVSRFFEENLFDLPAAKEEVEQIHQLMGGEKWIGSLATETTFKNNISKYDLAHLSLHGMINDKDPLYSKLIFHLEDSINDGYLNAHEIYQLPITSNLLVLSACNTGVGKIVNGEGVMSLARSFAYAGCPNLIASLWKADDKTTRSIMIDFYKYFKRDEKIADALRKAKINYLNNQNVTALRHPYFWAPFISFETQEKKPIGRYAYLAWLLVPILIFWLFWSRRGG